MGAGSSTIPNIKHVCSSSVALHQEQLRFPHEEERLRFLKGAMQPQSQELFQVQWPRPQESCFDHQKLKGTKQASQDDDQIIIERKRQESSSDRLKNPQKEQVPQGLEDGRCTKSRCSPEGTESRQEINY